MVRLGIIAGGGNLRWLYEDTHGLESGLMTKN